MQSNKLLPISCPPAIWLLIAAMVASLVTPARAEAAATVMGRYVHVMLPGSTHREMALAEVEVFSAATNVAFHKSTRQTSVGGDGVSELAVDGITDGDGAAALGAVGGQAVGRGGGGVDGRGVDEVDLGY